MYVVALTGVVIANAGIPDQVYALGEGDRRAIFQKLMAPEDGRCSSISDTFYQGADSSGAGFWSVQCSGKAYQLMIENTSGGSTKVLACDKLRRLGQSCFQRFK